LAEAILNGLIKEIQADRIDSVEVLQIRPSTLFRTSVTPELLARWRDYKVVFRKGDPHLVRLMLALKTANIRESNLKPDVRAGLIFYPSNNRQPVAVYFDGRGERGQINNIPVSFGGGLLAKVRAAVPLPF